MKRLRTAEQVVKALGGLDEVMKLTRANFKQAWHWTGRADAFPAVFHECMTKALQRKGYNAPARLWNQRGVGVDKKAA